MADVLLVCVRADIDRAEALADMFETAGLRTDGAPAIDEELDTASVGVIVWSEASLRSHAFFAAAQRLIGAGRAVIACLDGAPPARTISAAPIFDLSAWDGDPDDDALDLLFLAVDRLLLSARKHVAAAERELAPAPELEARPVALLLTDELELEDETQGADTEYFTMYGADAFAGLPVAWSVAEANENDSQPPPAPSKPPRRYAPQPARISLLRHGGAIARMMALVLIVGGGVAFAANSFTPRHEVQHAVREIPRDSAPFSAVVLTADEPPPDFIPESEPYEQAYVPHGREPASAPAGAWLESSATDERAQVQLLGDNNTPAPLPVWFDALHDDTPPAGAPLIAAEQTITPLGSSELPDELFKPEPLVKA